MRKDSRIKLNIGKDSPVKQAYTRITMRPNEVRTTYTPTQAELKQIFTPYGGMAKMVSMNETPASNKTAQTMSQSMSNNVIVDRSAINEQSCNNGFKIDEKDGKNSMMRCSQSNFSKHDISSGEENLNDDEAIESTNNNHSINAIS